MDMNLGKMLIRLGFAKLPGSDQTQQNFIKTQGVIAAGLQKLAGGFQRLKAPMQGFADKLGDGIAKLQGYRYQIVGAAAAIVGFTKNAAMSAAALTKFHNLTGMSMQSLQRWQQMAAMSGVSADEMTSSMMELQQKMQAIRMGQGDVAPWARLGIGVGGDPEKVMQDLSKRLNSMPKAMGVKFGRDLGLSDDMLNFLMEMRNLPEPDKNLILSDEEIRDLKDFNIAFNRIWDNAKRVMEKFGATMKPVAEWLMWVFGRLTRAFTTTINIAKKVGETFKGLGPIFAVLGTMVLASMFPMIAVVVALLAAWEDFATFMEGGDSLFGRLVEWLAKMAEEFTIVRVAIEAINAVFDYLLEKLAAFTEMGVGGLLGSIGEDMKGVWDWMMGSNLPGAGTKPTSPTGAAPAPGGATTTNATNMVVNINGSKEPKAIVDEMERRRNSPSNALFQAGTPERAGAKS